MEGCEGMFGLGSWVLGLGLRTQPQRPKTKAPRPVLLYRIQRHNLRAFPGSVEKRVRVGFDLRLLQSRLNFFTGLLERWHNTSTARIRGEYTLE